MIKSLRLLSNSESCLVRISEANFYKDSKLKDPVFTKAVKKFEVYKPQANKDSAFWSITGKRKSDFLSAIYGKYITHPPLSRTYPFISRSFEYDRVQLLDFKEKSNTQGIYLSARYETYSYKGVLEMSDDVNSVKNYITGSSNYNNNKEIQDEEYISKLMQYLNLKHLSNKWINSLSNGQFRRARIAKSLVKKPDLLVIDDPFLGLDPEATKLVSSSLQKISTELNMAIVLGLRIQDDVPQWIEQIGYVNDSGLCITGKKSEVAPVIAAEVGQVNLLHHSHVNHPKQKTLVETSIDKIPDENIHIEFLNASVVYKSQPILVNFNWKIQKGSRWRILGANGSGKTTIISLITADHPQSWKSVLAIDGKIRKTNNGSSFFDVNNRIGISSPEIHSLVPSSKSMEDVIYSGLVKNVGNSNFMFKGDSSKMSTRTRSILSKFEDILSTNGKKSFQDLSLTDQKLALFLRAIVANPELLILDEAFSCMDDEDVMIRCHNIVEHELPDTTVLTIGHIDWEVPKCDYALQLTGDQNRSYRLFQYV